MKRNPNTPRIAITTLLSAMLLLLPACGTLGGYNARAHEQLTSLKARHMKIIDDNTETEGAATSFSAAKLAQDADAAELAFREAEEFARTLNDPTRTENLTSLHEIFRGAAARIKKKAALLNTDQAGALRDAATQAYDLAIKGETVRMGGQSGSSNH